MGPFSEDLKFLLWVWVVGFSKSDIYDCVRLLKASYTGVKPTSLPVLSTEPVLRKVAVDREVRLSTEQYGSRRRVTLLMRFVKCAASVLFSVCFYIVWVQTVSEMVCCCFKCFGSLVNSLF